MIFSDFFDPFDNFQFFGLFWAILGTFSPIWAQTRFFPEMRFSQNIRGPLDLSFSAKKVLINGQTFRQNSKKTHFGPFWANLGTFSPIWAQ